MDLTVAWPKKGGALRGSIFRTGCKGGCGEVSPHGLLQAFDRFRRKVPLTRFNVDPDRHVFDKQKPPVDLNVVGHGLLDQWLGPYILFRRHPVLLP